MLATGMPAPDFETPASDGSRFRLSSLRGHRVILYFFPKAFAGGCTSETKGFGELAPGWAERGVRIVGISADAPETQRKFGAACAASFPILSDGSKAIARSYGVLSAFGFVRRVTFFIDESGTVQDVVAGLLPGPHLARAKERFGASGGAQA